MQLDNETSIPFSMMRIFYDRHNTPTSFRVSPTLKAGSRTYFTEPLQPGLMKVLAKVN